MVHTREEQINTESTGGVFTQKESVEEVDDPDKTRRAERRRSGRRAELEPIHKKGAYREKGP